MRRIILALALSIAVHVGIAGGSVMVGMVANRVTLPPIQLNAIDVEVKELPLGPPPPRESPAKPTPPSPPIKPRVRLAREQSTVALLPDAGVVDSLPANALLDGGAPTDAGSRKPGDLRRYGPEGSTLITLLRIDRLRESPAKEGYIAAVDQLLRLLPDRRRLIEGTGLDLYRDFNALLVATPDPRNDAVTFLAARHRLSDRALQKALAKGATSMSQELDWQTVAGRPVGIRRRAHAAPNPVMERDDRIFVLPAPSLAVMATPAHAKLLLGQDVVQGDGSAPDGGMAKPKPVSKSLKTTPTKGTWQDLVARIDAEDGAMPESAVFMLVANRLFTESSNSPIDSAAPDGLPASPPTLLTLLARIDPSPIVDLNAEFSTAHEAEKWEQALPGWRRMALANPLVLLSGFSTLLGRIEVVREENKVSLHLELTTNELTRLLNLVANLTRATIRRDPGAP